MVLDILISQGDIIDIFFHPSLKIIAPERLMVEFEQNYAEVAAKSKLSADKLKELEHDLLSQIEFFNNSNYRNLFAAARELLKPNFDS